MSFSCSILLVLCVCVSINFVSVQSFDAEKETIFRLYTRKNRDQGQIIRLSNKDDLSKSYFNFNHPTRFRIHGWNGGDSQSSASFTSAYLNVGEYNVIIVDWSAGANTPKYETARREVNNVGAVVARFIDWLNANGVAFSSIFVIGHDMGAHVAGMAGKKVKRGKIVKIVGLDPTGPLFINAEPYERLDWTDATYVEVQHTNRDQLGYAEPIGDADFYPNYGYAQPGCGSDFVGSCAHRRAIEYFEESLAPNRTFGAIRCRGFDDIRNNNCVTNGLTRNMGGETTNRPARGVYFLKTNPASPYSQGPFKK